MSKKAWAVIGRVQFDDEDSIGIYYDDEHGVKDWVEAGNLFIREAMEGSGSPREEVFINYVLEADGFLNLMYQIY